MIRQKDDSKISEIITASIELVVKTGFNSLKMADADKAAGIAVGTLYIYFQDKETRTKQIYIETKKEIASVLFKQQNHADNFL